MNINILVNLKKTTIYIILLIIIIMLAATIIIKHRRKEKKLIKLLNISEAMLEINQSIIGMDNINELFNLILEKAISIIDEAEYGCILILKENRNLKVEAYKGYEHNSIKCFTIPLEHSFQWLKTKGQIKDTVIINDIDNLQEKAATPIDEEWKKWKIKSCISTPIIINKKLYGMLNIDSDKKNAFTKEDIEVMKYMKIQIESAINKHKIYEEIAYLSKFDNLTNVYNMRYFEEICDKYFKKSIICNGDFNLVVFDINGLKKVNDTYGHVVGNQYIKTFTNKIRSIIDKLDILARYGGDEFVAIFFNKSSQVLIRKFEEIIKEFKDNPIKLDNNNIICSFSYGIANFPKDATCYNELVKIADRRMYQYKYKTKIGGER